MKLKTVLYTFVLCIFCFGLNGCKQDEWADWKLQNQLWLENNKTQPGIITTHTGLQYKVIAHPNPSERKPNSTSYVYVDYKGTLIDGTVFDSGDDVYFNLSSVIAGWTEGIQKMNVHDTYILYIPYNLAYGEEGSGSITGDSFIPPYSTLIFEVYLSNAMY